MVKLNHRLATASHLLRNRQVLRNLDAQVSSGKSSWPSWGEPRLMPLCRCWRPHSCF